MTAVIPVAVCASFSKSIYYISKLQLDIVLENVNATILVLNGVMEKLNQMTTEDQSKLHLDNTLGGRSEFLHRNTILK